MGLAAPRKKTKISHDPNNTNWSRSTSGFGHKILSSQGWTPGSFLGARNAAHADMFTAASASHIRVIVKDDTLGLGARSKRDPLDEPTGLDAFKGLLGRLNGKSDAELQADQRRRDNVKLARYAANKWQAVRFISGGLLAQEKDNETSSLSKEAHDQPEDVQTAGPRTPREERKETISTSSDHVNVRANSKISTIGESEVSKPCERKHKSNKDRKSGKENKEEIEKSKKKEKKERKRKRAEGRDGPDSSSSHEQSFENDASTSNEQDQPSSDAGLLVKERRPLGRHMIRGRHIAQKRKALMDEKSLNEIFMVKS